MRLISSAALALSAAVLLRAPAAAQTPEERMRACAGEPGSPLVGVVTDAATGAALYGAVVFVDEYTFGLADGAGCYAVIPQTELERGRRRVRVEAHRYVMLDTLLELSPERVDTVYFALRPTAPGCCRLQGEWSLRLTLNPESRELLESKRTGVEGPIVFSDRLPYLAENASGDSLRVEDGRFDLDLAALFGEEESEETELPVVMAETDPLLAEDFLVHAAGEVFADDSVYMQLVPAIPGGGIGLHGHIRGDSIVHGAWLQHGPCCGVGGSFTMRRVPGSPVGDSLVARGLRAADGARRAEAERRQRVGTLRLRVVDARTGRYARVDIYAQQGEYDVGPAGVVSTRADTDGWSDAEELLSGSYALYVNQFECDGAARIPNTELEENNAPIGQVVVQAGQAAELEVRVDLCAIKAYDFDLDGPVKIDAGEYAPPGKAPLPTKP
jgi:hypothetical protein